VNSEEQRKREKRRELGEIGAAVDAAKKKRGSK